jgi:hypothetical protein
MSACEYLLVHVFSVKHVNLCITYEVDEANWGALLSSLLAEVEETLSGLGSPGGVVVASLELLATEVVGEALHLNGISAEPEEALLETSKLPDIWVSILL